MTYADFNMGAVLQELQCEVKNVIADVFIGERPKAVPDKLQCFAVVDIASGMAPSVYGGGYGNVSTRLNVALYVRDKKGGRSDIVTLDGKLASLVALMPMSLAHCVVSRPRVLFSGSDGLGFCAVMVQCDLTIK